MQPAVKRIWISRESLVARVWERGPEGEVVVLEVRDERANEA